MAYLNEVGGGKKKQVFTLPVSYTTLAEYLCVDRSAMMREFKNLSEEGVLFREGKIYGFCCKMEEKRSIIKKNKEKRYVYETDIFRNRSGGNISGILV